MNVNNGRRVEISLKGYAGQAGLVEMEDKDVLSFPTASRLIHVPAGAEVLVDGVRRVVMASAVSPFLRGFKVLELERSK